MLSCKQEGQNQVYNVLRQIGNNKALSLKFHFLLFTPPYLVLMSSPSCVHHHHLSPPLNKKKPLICVLRFYIAKRRLENTNKFLPLLVASGAIK